MNQIRHIIRLLFCVVALSLALGSSCKKPPLVKPTDKVQGLTLDFRGMFGTTEIAFKTGEYTRSNGEILRVNNWEILLSKISLVKTDNTEILLGDGYLYVDFVGQKTKFNFPTAPAGDYKAISFQVGLDSAINHGDPTIWPADHPLNGNSTGLHWGWSTGYVFQKIDGNYKKPTDVDWNFVSLHTATDSFIRMHTMHLNFSLSSDGHKTARIELNIEEFFMNPKLISFATDGSSSHSIGTSEFALMKMIVDNSDDVYTLVEVK